MATENEAVVFLATLAVFFCGGVSYHLIGWFGKLRKSFGTSRPRYDKRGLKRGLILGAISGVAGAVYAGLHPSDVVVDVSTWPLFLASVSGTWNVILVVDKLLLGSWRDGKVANA